MGSQCCTDIAKAMVTQYGMSGELGPRKFGQEQGEVFLGRDYAHNRDYSDDLASQIDNEITDLIEHAHQEALAILVAHRVTLDALAKALIERTRKHLDRREAITNGREFPQALGTKLDDAALDKLGAACSAACRPIDDKRGTIEFRTKVAAVLAKRAAKIAFTRAGGK
jgi:predicted house-cleaning noncanonical NTP pyrophosphatase (MazG superfamily)